MIALPKPTSKTTTTKLRFQKKRELSNFRVKLTTAVCAFW